MALKHCTLKRAAKSTRNTATTTARSGHAGLQQDVEVRDFLQGATQLQPSAPVQSDAVASVAANSVIPANLHSAPADPNAVVTSSDARAGAYLTSATLFTSLASFSLDQQMNLSNSRAYQAYLSRFGPAPASGSQFRNRFTGTRYGTEAEAQARELESLSTRFGRLNDYLDGGIRYRSNSNRLITLSNCRDRCSAHPDWVMWTCHRRNTHGIALCPAFWSLAGGDSQRAVGIIHELFHQRYARGGHGSANAVQRKNNSECYGSFAADVFGVRPFDNRCPPV